MKNFSHIMYDPSFGRLVPVKLYLVRLYCGGNIACRSAAGTTQTRLSVLP